MRALPLVLLAGLLSTLAGVGAASAAPAETFRGVDGKWRRFESPHCELFSHVNELDSRKLLHDLELLHDTILETLGIRERRAMPLTVYYFASAREFLPYMPEAVRSEDRTAGFNISRPDRSTIVLSPAWDDEGSRRIIFHEYVHYITSLTDAQPALWYMEGIAEFFSTITERNGGLALGDAIPEHVTDLQQQRLMPLDVLFGVDHKANIYNEDSRSGLFYAESWALFHYWYCGYLKLTPEQMKRRDTFFGYAAAETENGDPESRRQIFRSALGMDYAAMEEELHRYVRAGRYYWFKRPMPQIAPASSYPARPMSRDEIRLRLAELDLRVNRSPTAKLALLDAVGRDPNEFRAREMLGMDAFIDGDESAARERWEEALAAGSTNPAIYYELAGIERHRWFSRFDYYFRLPPDTAAHLRDLLHGSIAAAPKQARAYEVLAWVEATAAKPSPADINLVQQHLGDVQEKGRTLLALAMVRTRAKDFATARSILKVLQAGPDGRKLARESQFLQDYIAKHDLAAEPK